MKKIEIAKKPLFRDTSETLTFKMNARLVKFSNVDMNIHTTKLIL